MKYLIIIALLFTGCTTAKVSEYKRGCLDGLDEIVDANNKSVSKDLREEVCSNLDKAHQEAKEARESRTIPGRAGALR